VEACGYQWQEVGHELILLQPQRGAESPPPRPE
jgi:hypothetical protein